MSSVLTLPHGPAVAGAVFVEAPGEIFQTNVAGGVQDSATPLVLRVSKHLFPAEFDIAQSRFEGTIRLFDGSELRTYHPDSGTMQGLRLGPSVFKFSPTATGVTVEVYRKHVPVSKGFGDAPFIFAFVATPPMGGSPHILVTSPFFVASKQPPEAKAPKEPPKRPRALPASKPVPAPPSATDLLLDEHFNTRTGGSLSALIDAPCALASGPSRVLGGSPPAETLPLPLAGSKRRPSATGTASGRATPRKQARPQHRAATSDAESVSTADDPEHGSDSTAPQHTLAGARKSSPPCAVRMAGFEVLPVVLPSLLRQASPELHPRGALVGAPPALNATYSPFFTGSSVSLAGAAAGSNPSDSSGRLGIDDGFSLSAFFPPPGTGGPPLALRSISVSSLGQFV